jgi:hypothetical protein
MKTCGSLGRWQKSPKAFTVALFCRRSGGVEIGQALGIVFSGGVKDPTITFGNQHTAVHKGLQKLVDKMLLLAFSRQLRPMGISGRSEKISARASSGSIFGKLPMPVAKHSGRKSI